MLFLLAMLIFLFPTEATTQQQEVNYGDNENAGHYYQTSDAKIYYEIYGTGKPLVLLHGGLFGYIQEFNRIIPDLSADHQVIAIATRGHGKSELGNQSLSYKLFAQDFAQVIQSITHQKVSVVGFSDGAIAGYYLAAQYPELIDRFTAVGAPLGLRGYTEAGVTDLSNYDSADEVEKLAPEFALNRKKLMPDATKWSSFVEQLAKMWQQQEYVSPALIRSIQCPVLIVGADKDEYARTEHLVEIDRLLPKGRLAILPAPGHTVFRSHPKLMTLLIRDFLNDNTGQDNVPAPASSGCKANPESRQFDFWIGEWNVTVNGRIAGTSSIQLILDDCVIFENWSGVSGSKGKSFNTYNAAIKKWQQFWVDNSGEPLIFSGNFKDDRMMFNGETPQADGKIRLERLTFFRLPENKVRQLWEQSMDQGKTWTTVFDGLYTHK